MKNRYNEPGSLTIHPINKKNAALRMPSFNRDRPGRWTEELFQWLFCLHPEYPSEESFLSREGVLKSELTDIIGLANPSVTNPGICAERFFSRLPHVHVLLVADMEAMFNADPAAGSVQEVLLAYPGFFAISVHRVAHELWTLKVPVIPRLLSEYAHFKTGIDIHPGAAIGERFLIDHGTGVVIGETCTIGNDVKIYQGVTLGALSVSRNDAATRRHPAIGDRVVVYANATILGGNTLIGSDSVIGGNVWITRSVPAGSIVFHKSEIVIKNNTGFPEPLNFII